MQNNLFNIKKLENNLSVDIFADESFNRACPYSGDIWHYTVLVIIPSNLLQVSLNRIICTRHNNVADIADIDSKSEYYFKNDRIIHFNELRNKDEFFIAKRWLDFLLNTSISDGLLYISILGVNESRLDKSNFGEGEVLGNIYNRFFRSAVLYPLKKFFKGYDNIIINQIYHEVGEHQHHDFFPWHIIHKINFSDDNIVCNFPEIIFLGKSHRDGNDMSNILQLADLFLGVTTNVIHNTSTKELRVDLSKIIFPLVQRMVGEPNNYRGRYKQGKRFSISFFPGDKKTMNIQNIDLKKINSYFYQNRSLAFKDKFTGQTSLF